MSLKHVLRRPWTVLPFLLQFSWIILMVGDRGVGDEVGILFI